MKINRIQKKELFTELSCGTRLEVWSTQWELYAQWSDNPVHLTKHSMEGMSHLFYKFHLILNKFIAGKNKYRKRKLLIRSIVLCFQSSEV